MSYAQALTTLLHGRLWSPDVDPLHWTPRQKTTLADWGTPYLSEAWELDESEAISRASELERWKQEAVAPFHRKAALLDTTTLHSVVKGIEGRHITPTGLFDLNTFATAAVMFDQVVHLENPQSVASNLNDRLTEQVVRTLPIADFGGQRFKSNDPNDPSAEENSAEGLMAGLWKYSRHYVRTALQQAPEHAEERAEIKQRWKQLTGVEPDDADLENRNYFDLTWGTPGPAHLSRLLNPQALLALESQRWSWFTPEQFATRAPDLFTETNCRYVFNQSVSAALELPYLPNSFRVPFRRQFLQSRQNLLETTVDWAKELDFDRGIVGLKVPIVLAAILAKINKPDEYYEALAEFRDKAAGFRAEKAELEHALLEEDTTGLKNDRIRKLVEATNQQSSSVFSKAGWALLGAGAVVGGVSSYITALPFMTGLAVVGLAAAPGPAVDIGQRLWRRIRRPELRFSTALREAAGSIHDNDYTRVCRIWGLEQSNIALRDTFYQQFQIVSQ